VGLVDIDGVLPAEGAIAPEAGDAGDAGAPSPNGSRINRKRLIAGIVVILIVLGFAAHAVNNQRKAFFDALSDLGAGTLVLSLVCALIGVGLTFPVWRTVLGGLGVRFSVRESARVFFTSQLGKYLPGAVWPALLQMEAGRNHGASRRTMLAANLITLTLGCTTGLIVAATLLPIYDSRTLDKYWYVLLALPPLFALLHPRTIPWLLNKLFVLLRQPPMQERLNIATSLRASGWNIASWAFEGASLAILAISLDGFHVATIVLCTGAISLAVVAGVLFIPAPAGAGIRDVVLQLALLATLTSGQALAVVVASRSILVIADVLLAGLAALIPKSPVLVSVRPAR